MEDLVKHQLNWRSRVSGFWPTGRARLAEASADSVCDICLALDLDLQPRIDKSGDLDERRCRAVITEVGDPARVDRGALGDVGEEHLHLDDVFSLRPRLSNTGSMTLIARSNCSTTPSGTWPLPSMPTTPDTHVGPRPDHVAVVADGHKTPGTRMRSIIAASRQGCTRRLRRRTMTSRRPEVERPDQPLSNAPLGLALDGEGIAAEHELSAWVRVGDFARPQLEGGGLGTDARLAEADDRVGPPRMTRTVPALRWPAWRDDPERGERQVHRALEHGHQVRLPLISTRGRVQIGKRVPLHVQHHPAGELLIHRLLGVTRAGLMVSAVSMKSAGGLPRLGSRRPVALDDEQLGGHRAPGAAWRGRAP